MTYSKKAFNHRKALIYISLIVSTFFMLTPQNVLAQTDPVPILTLEATSEVVVDADESDSASVGDTLLYRVIVTNESETTATEVRFLGRLDEHLTLIEDSVSSSQGTARPGIFAQVELGELPGGESAMIEFQATVEASVQGDQVLTSVQISFAESSEAPDETGGLTQDQNLVATPVDAPTSLPTAEEPSVQSMIFLPIIR